MKRNCFRILAILCIIGVLALISFLILPELANTLYSLASSIPGFVNEIKDFLQNVSDNPLLTKQNLMKIDLDWNKISTELMGFFQTSASNILGSTVSVISSAVQTVVTFLLGTVFAVNALLKKEKLVLQTKKLLYSYLKESYADRIVCHADRHVYRRDFTDSYFGRIHRKHFGGDFDFYGKSV